MAFVNDAFSVRRGNDRLIEISVAGENGDLDLTGAKIRLSYGKTVSKALKTMTEADLTVAGTIARYRMKPAETRALEADRTYWIEAIITFSDGTADGFRETVATGSFIVEQTQG